jgi:GTP-binding protein
MLNFFRVGKPPGKLVLVDAPGYGMRGRAEWGELFDHYVDNRAQYVISALGMFLLLLTLMCRLRRIYLLINAKHGVTEFDKNMLQHLNDKLKTTPGTRAKLSLQAILTKVDTIPADDASTQIKQIQADIFTHAPICMPPLLTAINPKLAVGIDAVRASIVETCGV